MILNSLKRGEINMLLHSKRNSRRLKDIKSNDPVWKWMTSDPLTIQPQQTLREAILIMQDNKIDGIPVINEEQRVIGLLTKSSIMDCFIKGISLDCPVSDFMTKSVITIGKKESIGKAFQYPVGRLPVVDEQEKLIGILTRTDILFSYASYLEQVQETLHSAVTLNTILETAYEGIAVVDKNGTIMEINEAYCRFLGKRREDALGKHVTNIIENTRLHIVIQTGVTEKGFIQRIHGQDMVVHRIPIWKDGVVIGAIGMLIFQGVKELYNILERMQVLSRQVTENKVIIEPTNKKNNGVSIIGRSEEIQAVKRIARKVASKPSTVLITGDSGTGKELFAKYIHELSAYSEGPFISVNCAAIPEHLLEAELFGYEEGAFTGAKKGGKPGKFELAHKGTLFLDEVGDMSLLMQSKILRVLQEKELERVGGVDSHNVDVRIIAATNRPLETMVKEKTFREDLYYRLNIIKIEIPPLKNRKEDIPVLLMYHLTLFCNRFGIPQKNFSIEAMNTLMNYHWPGNVRELVNTVEMLVSLSESGTIEENELPPKFTKKQSVNSGLETFTQKNTRVDLMTKIKDSALESEKALIIKTLVKTNGNKAEAARRLGIQRSTLYEKLKKHGISNK